MKTNPLDFLVCSGAGIAAALSSASLSRRTFLGRASVGLGSAALASLLNPRAFAANASRAPHYAPKAKRIIWLTQSGAPSQLDLFDYKPGLALPSPASPAPCSAWMRW